jgi:uncharacterized membrane protein YgcG
MMKRFLALAATVFLLAATPQEALPGLEADGFYIEPGSNATEQVVGDAVFDGRADGGRLYIVVLADEPPSGAITFSDSVLDLLGGGYVFTVGPETVGWAGDGSFWSAEEMDAAVDASLSAGASDDAVVTTFIETLIAQPTTGGGGGDDQSVGGGISIWWVVLAAAAIIGIWMAMSRRTRSKRIAQSMEEVKALAKAKLDEVANDILEMEDEVAVSENAEAKEHYQRASAMYAQAIDDNSTAASVREMLKVSEELDLAIWELDCAEALLDGKPKPPKPQPPEAQVTPPPPPVPDGRGGPPPDEPGTVDPFDRRPQRQSSGSNDMLTMLMTMMAMGGMRGGGGGFGGGFGGFRGGGGGGSMGGGGSRMSGGGGRMRGGGRRGG